MNEDTVNLRFFGELVFDEFSDFGFVAKVGGVVDFVGETKRTDFGLEGGLELFVGHNGSGGGVLVLGSHRSHLNRSHSVSGVELK